MTTLSRSLAACALCVLVTAPLQSAPPEVAKVARNAAKRSTDQLAMLDGQWSGTAWVIAPDGKKYELPQSGTVCPAIFGEVRVMDGRGTMGGITRFHAERSSKARVMAPSRCAPTRTDGQAIIDSP